MVRSDVSSKVIIAKSAKISNSEIFIAKGATLIIGEGCVISNVKMMVKGSVILGKENTLDNGYYPAKLPISVDGNFVLGERNRIRSKIWIRFNATLTIGDYNNINEESEIRCDEAVSIGSFNQISYKCMIWDTNTHNIYPDEQRRELTTGHFPFFGYEFEKPKTKPVVIGSDCWIGREAVLLKGAELKNSSIVGFRTTLSNCVIEERKVVVPKSNNIIFDREV
jgi:acetyltransferase-like isoleucine patch superfamily enzyme